MESPLAGELVELRPQPHRVDDHRVLAQQIEHADLQRGAVSCGPMSIVKSSSMSIFGIAVRTACQMSESLIPCLRAGSPILT
jgi:hypothetical protein